MISDIQTEKKETKRPEVDVFADMDAYIGRLNTDIQSSQEYATTITYMFLNVLDRTVVVDNVGVCCGWAC